MPANDIDHTIDRGTGIDRHTVLHGRRFHYRAVGDPAAPTVLMLHGIMGHAREWDVLVEALAATHRVVAVDQRGHGATEWAAEYTVAAMADDLIALVEHLGVSAARVIGHSMGGMVAMVAAARRPDLFERIVVVDVGPDSVTGELAEGLAPFVRALGQASYDSVDEAYAEWSSDPLARPELLRHYVEHNLVSGDDDRLAWRFDGAGLERFLGGVSESELWDAVDGVACPVLLLRGEHSPALSPSTADEMVRRFADARLAVIPGGAHDLGVQQPEAVAAAAGHFLTLDLSATAALG